METSWTRTAVEDLQAAEANAKSNFSSWNCRFTSYGPRRLRDAFFYGQPNSTRTNAGQGSTQARHPALMSVPVSDHGAIVAPDCWLIDWNRRQEHLFGNFALSCKAYPRVCDLPCGEGIAGHPDAITRTWRRGAIVRTGWNTISRSET